VVAFQIAFRVEIHANDVFLFFKNHFWYQHIKTIQKVQTTLNFNKNKFQNLMKRSYNQNAERSRKLSSHHCNTASLHAQLNREGNNFFFSARSSPANWVTTHNDDWCSGIGRVDYTLNTYTRIKYYQLNTLNNCYFIWYFISV
jgi:hypothetical protein